MGPLACQQVDKFFVAHHLSVSLFVLLADGLARFFGTRALWSLLAGKGAEEAFGPLFGRVSAIAGWQDWLRRRVPPFAPDALDAVAWLKLADACRGHGPLDELVWRAAEVSPSDARALSELPQLVEEAERTGWPSLPWWSESATDEDLLLVGRAVDAMFQVNVMEGTFQTHPSEPPKGELFLDVEACLLFAHRRPAGVFAEPSRWIVPPPLCRLLHERGARLVRFEGVRRSMSEEVARTL